MDKKTFYCPDCKSELEEESGCGSVSYFCPKCKKLVSRSKMLETPETSDNKPNE